jgi:hypothetical protein
VLFRSPSNGKETRRILNESSSFTFFIHSSNAKIRYFLENYVGHTIDKKWIENIKKKAEWKSFIESNKKVFDEILEYMDN